MLSTLEQNAIFSCSARAGHNGRRRCQPKCTRASDNENGYRLLKRLGEAAWGYKKEPYYKGDYCNAYHNRYKYTGNDIRYTLDRSLRALCFFNDSNNLGECRIMTYLHRPNA
ncbi:hypothetical protein D3C80_1287860 [compost metagenome]